MAATGPVIWNPEVRIRFAVPCLELGCCDDSSSNDIVLSLKCRTSHFTKGINIMTTVIGGHEVSFFHLEKDICRDLVMTLPISPCLVSDLHLHTLLTEMFQGTFRDATSVATVKCWKVFCHRGNQSIVSISTIDCVAWSIDTSKGTLDFVTMSTAASKEHYLVQNFRVTEYIHIAEDYSTPLLDQVMSECVESFSPMRVIHKWSDGARAIF